MQFEVRFASVRLANIRTTAPRLVDMQITNKEYVRGLWTAVSTIFDRKIDLKFVIR